MSRTFAGPELHRFRIILETRVAELEQDVRQRDGISVEPSADQVEEVQRASERALAICHIDRESKQLREARVALRRLHEGTYGSCQRCGEAIPLKRLRAVPWASLCLVCQEHSERRQSVHKEDPFLTAA